jgi:CRP/FNR family transcriptional regulator, cyclic AMP receptor protein
MRPGADDWAEKIGPVTIKGVFRSARKTLTLSPGDVLFSEGEVGDEMYGVISGLFELRRGDRVVQQVGPDGTFGELAIIDASPRTLTAIAVEPSEIAVINRHEFLFLVHETPTFAIDVMRSLSSLIRELNLNT